MKLITIGLLVVALFGYTGTAARAADPSLFALPAGEGWATAGIPVTSGLAFIQGDDLSWWLMVCTGGQGCEVGNVVASGAASPDGADARLASLLNPQGITPPAGISIHEGDRLTLIAADPGRTMVIVDYDARVTAVLHPLVVPGVGS